MKAGRSLRTRLVVGSVVWTAGVMAIASAIATKIFRHHPELANVTHNAMLTVFAFGCVIAGWSYLRRSLSPFDSLRAKLKAVRDGGDRRVEGSYPKEVQPLVDDLNALLEDRERSVARARTEAGDLAHGLKTPLAVLFQEATRAEAAGHAELADLIRQQVQRMQRQVDHHLAHARAAAAGATPTNRCVVLESAQGLARTLLRLHAERGLAIEIVVPPDHAVRVQREDLDEMLGNLLDNACTWGRARVSVGSIVTGTTVAITVDDDGPGIDPSMRATVLQRGVRADEATPGSGFGLAIVGDIASLYGGAIALDRSPHGGLRARLSLPIA